MAARSPAAGARRDLRLPRDPRREERLSRDLPVGRRRRRRARSACPTSASATSTTCSIDVRRITDVCALPLLVDVDTGFGASAFNIARTVRSLEKVGAAAMHIEDQVGAKRCGHRPGKAIVPADEMVDRMKAAVDARTDPAFGIMARTDALAVEGLAVRDRPRGRLRRGRRGHGLPRGDHRPRDVPAFVDAVKVPMLANITEFGATPLFTVDELRATGIAIVLYPLSAFRAMNQAALNVYRHLRTDGTQRERRRHDADARRPLRVPGLPRLRAQARRACSPRRPDDERHRHDPRAQAQEVRRAVRRHRRQHGALHRRPHRQRSSLPRLRHPRHRRHLRIRGDRLPAGARQAAQRRRARRLQGEAPPRCAACPRRCTPCSRRCPRARIRWT